MTLVECCFTSTETVGLLGTVAQDDHHDFHTAPELWIWHVVEVLLYVHTNRRFIRDGSPGRPPRLSHSSWALRCGIKQCGTNSRCDKVNHTGTCYALQYIRFLNGKLHRQKFVRVRGCVTVTHKGKEHQRLSLRLRPITRICLLIIVLTVTFTSQSEFSNTISLFSPTKSPKSRRHVKVQLRVDS